MTIFELNQIWTMVFMHHISIENLKNIFNILKTEKYWSLLETWSSCKNEISLLRHSRIKFFKACEEIKKNEKGQEVLISAFA